MDVDWQDRFSSSSGFTENLGQFGDPSVLFYTSGPFGSIAFQERGILLNIEEPASGESTRRGEESNWGDEAPFPLLRSSRGPVTYGSTVRLSFIGADEVAPEGEARLHEYNNYFLGDDPTRWATRVPIYREVVYSDLYQGIDLVYREEGQRIKYEYIVHPGADPSRIITRVEGHDSLQVADGNLVISTKAGEITDSGLDVFYLDGPEEKVACEFELFNPDTYGFRLSPYDRSRTLVIDPLVYGTFFGGSDGERAYVVVDSIGDPYLIGGTESDDFPTTPGSYQLDHNGGQFECFISKFSSDGKSLVFSTFLGGSDWDSPGQALIDQSGNIYLSGSTMSSDFPTTSGAYQEDFGGGSHWSDDDCYLLKLNATGDRLIYSTYIGSDDDDDQGGAICLASDGSVIMNGLTRSSNFNVTQGAFQTIHNGGREAFVCKLNPQGSDLVFSTFLGGSDNEGIAGIAVDSNGSIYVSGETSSTDFPTTAGAYQTTLKGRYNAFITKLSSDGSSLVYSTYLGGDESTRAAGILVDGSDSAHVTGYTGSSNFPTTPGAFKTTHTDDETDIFITRLSADGKSLVSSTLLGGERGESASGILLDEEDNVCLCGETRSTQFPTTKAAPQKSNNGGEEAIVCKLSADYSELLYSTYLGGQSYESAYSIAFDSRGLVWVGGYTHSTDFPTTEDAHQTHLNGQETDGFLCKVNMDTKAPAADAGPDVAIDQHQNVTFNGTNSTDNIDIVNWTWSFIYDGEPRTLYNSTANFTFHDVGLYNVTLTIRDEGTNTGTDTMNVTVRDITPPVADAGILQIINEDRQVNLDGTRSIDNVAIVNWTWTFTYNGTTVTLFGPDPVFTFHVPGEYEINLNVTDAMGLWDIDHVTIHVLDVTDPVAVAPGDITMEQHDKVALDGTGSTDNVAIVNWTWGFVYRGSPMSLFGDKVEFTFEDAGVFLVTLTVSDAAGNLDLATFDVTVVDTTPPVADAGEDREIDPGTTLYLDATGSSDNVRIASYAWTFVYQDQDIELDGAMPSYFFEAAGTYLVTLTVTDMAGNVDTDTVNITVPALEPPSADAGEDIEVNQGAFVTFDASGSSDNLGIVTWSWSFLVEGVPVTSEDEVWDYMFAVAGTYEVKLRVEDAVGFHAEDTMTVTVNDMTVPVPAHQEDVMADQWEEVTFDASASTDNVGVVSWTWAFTYEGEDRFLEGETVQFTFDVPGEYLVTLNVDDAAGHTGGTAFFVRVRDIEAPLAPRLKDIEARAGDEVTFDGVAATDNVGVVSWTWTFEEGGETVTLEGMQVEHTFDEPGEYEVTLTVVDANRNEATETFTVTVSGGAWMWVLVAVIVVAVALVAVVMMRRSRG